MADMTVEEAAKVLNACERQELRDHAFGDAEVSWIGPSSKNVIALGYFGGSHASVYFNVQGQSFYGVEATSLRLCGQEGRVERNDETGPEEYSEGKMLDSMTKGAVFEELTGKKLREEE